MSTSAGSAHDGMDDYDRRHIRHSDIELDRRDHLLEREKDKFGGVKIGSAFFGWLTATGTAVLLTALAAAIFGAIIVDSASANADPQTVGIIGAIVLAVILLIAYFCGGYVAGRMARFNGVKQGIAVWIWAIVIAIIVGILGAIAGSQFNILAQVNTFPQVPNLQNMTTTGIISAIIAVVIALVGAILGGMAGMRFHRKVDKANLID
ncbi:hypothetical protein GCM10009784_25440 [Arthrobacter parietis]|uniref:Major facilitator superfamily (MFS) profile domain-containing protein n=2 Tax=Arthrobacter TaxID=1663 RepID=A0ABT6CUE6_9MICC|nr:hypothetical protein [Arthrobacter vasquezii]MDF9277691.1 hypothetical protein [Arthrobacter vasquezii]